MLSKEKIDSFIRADTYRVLSKGFSYPDEKNISEMKSIVEELISSPHLDRNIYHYLEKILSTIEVGELQKEYSRLFLKGAIPIYESSYNLNFDVIPNVSAFYTAFGLSPKSGESPDSLPYELEFASILSLKTALAQNQDNEDITKEAYKKFLYFSYLYLALALFIASPRSVSVASSRASTPAWRSAVRSSVYLEMNYG